MNEGKDEVKRQNVDREKKKINNRKSCKRMKRENVKKGGKKKENQRKMFVS